MADLLRRLRHRDMHPETPSLPLAAAWGAAILAGALAALSLSRPWWSGASWPGAVGAAVTVSACAWLVHASLRSRAMTIAALTGVIVLTAFWAKWVADSEPLKIYFIEVPADNDLAVQVTGAFALTLTIGWLAGQHLDARGARARVRDDAARRHASWLPHPALLVVAASALHALKVAMAAIYSIGVPGETPHGLEVTGLKTVIYYSSTFGPMACASLLMLSKQVRPWVRWGSVSLVLLGYAAAGAYVGSRAATVNAALVLVFVALAGSWSDRARPNPRHALAWLGVAAAVIVSLALTLARRPIGSSSAGPLGMIGFLEDRIGGLDFLSVAAAGVDQYGSSLTYADTTAWVEFLTFTVYEYPEGSVTGVASTLPGTAFGIGGWVAVVLVGLVSGFLIALVDVRYARTSDPAVTTWYLGLFLAWSNLLLEGTLYPTLLIILSFGSVYVLLLLVGRRLGNGTREKSAAGSSAGSSQPTSALRR